MKIIRHRLGRRPEYWAERVERKPRKKALLVGIQYERDEEEAGETANALRGPHKDVAAMRELLIDSYSYSPDDIVVLIDTNEPGQTQPTRDNMIRAIKDLVEDPQPGDRFFFHYAGHTVQVPNTNFSEEDGMDECIIPSDGEARMIKDNELRRHLVDSLPIGSNLVAIFDSCHSASLLDLEHFRCNRPYVPWISKGRRKSDSQWNANMRRHALVVSRHVYQSKRVSSSSVRSRRTSIDQILLSSPDYRKLTIRTQSLSIKSDFEKWYDTPSSPIQRTSSPDSMWPCTGYCPPESPKEANVIAVSACKDDQLSWEDSDGASMTQALIDILKSDPHPKLISLMANISHQLHGFYLKLHSHARNHRKQIREINKRRVAKGRPPLRVPTDSLPEMNNFQDPQMSSHRPVPRDAIWDP
ncbi:putative to MEROPS cysteine peptidase family C14 [Lyophyllum shimeji]|uniref:To MEROPS cysteine peptidase family C14 n=1 Tax=Lyophyllum shimeji TaxID=47721 RepID=A0A9P3UTU0_LYOSH|nr:putative to MEROPS cysteine peptidase family C14 [Lyophyllum shimeji]